MRISNAYPSKYLSANDLGGREYTMSINSVRMEEVGDETQKPVVYFQGAKKGLVLNKTNASNIAVLYGDETDAWRGKQVTLFTAYVDFQGRSVPAIRVKPVAPNSQPDNGWPGPDVSPASQKEDPLNDPLPDDSIPF